MMSGELAKREMETGDKPTTSHGKASSEESRNKEKRKEKKKEKKTSSHKSHRNGNKIKKMRKVVYYETDSSSPSTSGSDTSSVTSKRHEHKKFSKIPLRYPRIPKHTPLLSVPLGKPPTFDGERRRWRPAISPLQATGRLHRKSPATKGRGRKGNPLPTSRIGVTTRKRR